MKFDKDFIEKVNEDGLIYLILVSLISADTLLTAEDCETSIEYLKELQENIPLTSLPDSKKEEYLEFCKKGLDICEGDLLRFKNQQNDEKKD